MDEVPTTVIFTLYLALAVYWAELYFLSLDNLHEPRTWLRRTERWSNILAYTLLTVNLFIRGTIRQQNDIYLGHPYAYVTAAAYVLAAGFFLVAAVYTAAEFRNVPIQVQMRQKRVSDVSRNTIICTTCILLRAAALIYLAQERIYLVTY
ncbi:unnamed protein product, partial [Choristocarpus tenellus]